MREPGGGDYSRGTYPATPPGGYYSGNPQPGGYNSGGWNNGGFLGGLFGGFFGQQPSQVQRPAYPPSYGQSNGGDIRPRYSEDRRWAPARRVDPDVPWRSRRGDY